MVDIPPPVTAPAAQVLAERRAGNRDAALAGLKQVREAAAVDESVDPDPPAPVEPVVTPSEAHIEAPPEPVVEPVPAVVEPLPEPPGMAQVRKAEQHMRRQLAAEREKAQAELDQQRAQWQARIDKATEFETLRTTARQNPIEAISALGFTADDFDALGRLIYAHGPEGQKNPANRATASQTLAQREQATQLQKLQAKIDQLEQFQTQTLQQQRVQQQLDAYADGVVRTIGEATPLAKTAFAKNPTKVRQALLDVADRLYTSSGPSDDLRDVPTPAEVLKAYEDERRAELELYGIDFASLGRPAAAPAVAPAPAPARPAATIAPAGTAAPTVPKITVPMTQDELRAKALEGMAKIRTAG